MGTKRADIDGKRFGRLLVVGYDHTNKWKESVWRCKCDCGEELLITAKRLNRGAKSCGCLRNARRKVFHGGSKLPLYKRWSDMIQRCTNKNNERYKDYGGRGITVCDEWRDFSTFKAWAEENGYSKSLQLDRIDNDRGYSPENCRFVTPKENAGHRRVTAYMECDGRRQSIAAWSRETGIPYDTIRARRLYGWDDERALKTPVIKKNKQQNEGG